MSTLQGRVGVRESENLKLCKLQDCINVLRFIERFQVSLSWFKTDAWFLEGAVDEENNFKNSKFSRNFTSCNINNSN